MSEPVMNFSPQDVRTLENIQKASFAYFLRHVNRENGLVADRSAEGSPASIAAMGLALTIWSVGVERGFISRIDAAGLTVTMLRFLARSRHDGSARATGGWGFYYHFLDMKTGERVWESELSTIDTALLIAGVLSAGVYFDRDDTVEKEIRETAKLLYDRVDWKWAMEDWHHFSHGWTPEYGFIPWSWDEGYSEALLLYILALGAEKPPFGRPHYDNWTRTFEWASFYGKECVYAGPLFIHQLPQVWIDFRGLQDDYMRAKGIDYFENSRRATLIQHEYAVRNPHGYEHYGLSWGFTAGDGPGPCTKVIDGRERTFYGYIARGVPLGIDDGTLSPWAAVTSLPFSPGLVMNTIRGIVRAFDLDKKGFEHFDLSYNPTFPDRSRSPNGWVSEGKLGINQGPMFLMIENATTGNVWKRASRCEPIRRGLERAGFSGGWLRREARELHPPRPKEL